MQTYEFRTASRPPHLSKLTLLNVRPKFPRIVATAFTTCMHEWQEVIRYCDVFRTDDGKDCIDTG